DGPLDDLPQVVLGKEHTQKVLDDPQLATGGGDVLQVLSGEPAWLVTGRDRAPQGLERLQVAIARHRSVDRAREDDAGALGGGVGQQVAEIGDAPHRYEQRLAQLD